MEGRLMYEREKFESKHKKYIYETYYNVHVSTDRYHCSYGILYHC